jgi:hypothetical protein
MTDTPAELRKQLLANGYSPLPNKAKACFLTEWPTVEITPEVIDRWGRRHSRYQDTGLRIENGLAAADLDVNDPIAERILDAWEAEIPALKGALLRYGKGHKLALFYRTTEAFSRIHSYRFTAPGENVDEHGTHVIEIFGGAASRQFGAFGAHTRADNGEVLVEYEWTDGSPLDTPLDDLPELDKATQFKMVEIGERVLRAAGFEQVLKTTKGESEAHRVYDLVDDMTFETAEGFDDVPLVEIEKQAQAKIEGLRVSASFIEPGRLHSRTRCLVGLSGSGQLTIWDSATGVTHMRASLEPKAAQERQAGAADVATKLKRLAEAESERKARRRAKLNAEDDAQTAAGKMLQTYAYCPNQPLNVVPLWAESVAEGKTLTNFRTEMLPWCDIEIGPKGGEKKINPADIWSSSRERVTVEGLRLRPDQPRPVFEEGGRKYVNVYKPAEHPTEGGDGWGGWALLRQLIPDERERRYFIQWLAFKWLNPGVPGPAILMVARQFGTGRGTLGELLKRLFGRRYVATIGFDHFTGRTYQSQYTAWQADALVVLVNESSTADAQGSQYRAKHDTYERLKEIVDPHAQERTIVTHGKPAYKAVVCASFVIATNNPDALPLPPEDRRFAVLTNGEPRDPAFWEEINAWMEDEANVGAFVRELEAVDLAGYSPYAPPLMTEAKAGMTELSRSDLDRAFDEAVAMMPGEVILPEQIINAIRELKTINGYDLPERWEAMARKMTTKQLYKVGVQDGEGYIIKVGARKFRTYARTPSKARQWAGERTRSEALKNGDPTASKSPEALFQKLRLAVDNGQKE